MSKIGDILNPFDDVGAALAKGGLAEAVKALRSLMAEYPVLGALAQGKRVKGEVSFSLQLRVED